MQVLISRMSIGEKSECLFMAYVCVCVSVCAQYAQYALCECAQHVSVCGQCFRYNLTCVCVHRVCGCMWCVCKMCACVVCSRVQAASWKGLNGGKGNFQLPACA